MKNRGRLYPFLAVLGVFMLGGFSGLGLGRIGRAHEMERFLTARPADNLDLRISMVSDHLGLDSDQRQRLRVILTAYQEEFAALRRGIEPQVAAVRQREFDEIRKMLNPRQRVDFDRLLQQKQNDSDALPAVPPRPD